MINDAVTKELGYVRDRNKASNLGLDGCKKGRYCKWRVQTNYHLRETGQAMMQERVFFWLNKEHSDFEWANQMEWNPYKAGPYPGNLDEIKLLAFGYDDYDVLCLDTLGKFNKSRLSKANFGGLYCNDNSRTGISRWRNQDEYPWRLYFMGLGCD